MDRAEVAVSTTPDAPSLPVVGNAEADSLERGLLPSIIVRKYKLWPGMRVCRGLPSWLIRRSTADVEIREELGEE